jgi:general stress protein CsbA
MMEKRGAGIESNPLGRFMFDKFGYKGIIASKLIATSIILTLAWFIAFESYWVINGLLVGLTIGGLMATQANLQATEGKPFKPPNRILLEFGIVTVVLMIIGIVIDFT